MLKRGVKVFKRPLVNEVLRLHLTEFFPDPTHMGATPIQRVVKLIRHSAPPRHLEPLLASADGGPCTYKTMHAAMIVDAAMIANVFPLMPQRHPATTAVLSFDLKDMRLSPAARYPGG